MNQAAREAERIEDDLGRTRARLDATLGELQARLSPGQLLDEALGYVKQSGGAEFGRNLMDNVKGNPLPVALVGIGLAWLMAGGGRSGRADAGPTDTGRHGSAYGLEEAPAHTVYPGGSGFAAQDDDLDEHVSLYDRAVAAAGEARRRSDESIEAFEERAYAARGSVLGVMRSAGETFTDYRERVDAMFREAGERSRGALRRARDRVGAGSERARAHGQRAMTMLQDQPLLLGALGLSAGSLLAALLPKTRSEDEWMGPWRDQVRRQAGELASDMMRRGERVAEDVARATTESAEREGLSPEELQRRVERVSGEVAETAGAVRRTAEDAAAAARESIDREMGGTARRTSADAGHGRQ